MAEFTENTSTFKSIDGINIFYRHYPAEEERAILLIAHGLGEHSGRYKNVVRHLVPKGISIWAIDHRGHGKSEGKRGHVNTFPQYISDLRGLYEIAKSNKPDNRKIFLLGHSLGGLIALYMSLKFPELLNGVIVSSPVLGVTVKIPVIKEMVGNTLSDIWPDLTLSNEIDYTKISRDVNVQRAYKNDPLVHDQVSTRWFTECMKTMDMTNKLAQELSLPILMQVAGDDYLVDAKSSKAFFERLICKDKTLYVYDELYHEIYNELPHNRAIVLSDLEHWLEARI
ncbi:MAG: alpha/beta hydrolase [Desulfobacterales bacterium]|nr:alpha/beta hydrolase [Desulfobacterales bacterium]MBF0397885.1 alpha/beta hydrolase [Desulfobacterales bacterium]